VPKQEGGKKGSKMGGGTRPILPSVTVEKKKNKKNNENSEKESTKGGQRTERCVRLNAPRGGREELRRMHARERKGNELNGSKVS